MHSLRPTVLLAVLLSAACLAAARSARADESKYLKSKAALSRHMEDLMHYLLRGDAADVQHVGIEFRESLARTIAAAKHADLSEFDLDRYSDIFDDVAALTEEAADSDLEKATDLYLDVVDACFDCHNESREVAWNDRVNRGEANSAATASWSRPTRN